MYWPNLNKMLFLKQVNYNDLRKYHNDKLSKGYINYSLETQNKTLICWRLQQKFGLRLLMSDIVCIEIQKGRIILKRFSSDEIVLRFRDGWKFTIEIVV